MTRRAVTAISILATLGAACSSVRTHYDYDPRVDFGIWRTYAWYPSGPPRTGDPRLDDPLLHGRIVTAVERTLDDAGFAQVQEAAPDFYVNYHLSTEHRLDVFTTNSMYRGGPHMRHWGGAGWGGVGWTETHVHEYEEGTLVIDFLDVASRTLAWRGSGTRRLSGNPRPDQVTRRVDEAVKQVLRQFPPR